MMCFHTVINRQTACWLKSPVPIHFRMHCTGLYQSISKLNLASEEEPAAFAKVCGLHGIKHLEDIEFYWRHLVSSKQDIHEQN